ncbi:MAG: hypothetical protein JXX14_19710 [Deltaproteobacteria bacterium]|nr:hypothetical protein [Deltaproteobacteria bacterium]
MNKTLFVLIIALFLLVLSGCNEDSKPSDDNDTTGDTASDTGASPEIVDIAYTAQHLKRIQSLQTMTLSQVSGIFVLVQLQVPEAAQMTSGLTSAVSVFRMTYQTTYNNTPVLASALVAIPASNGPLPVLAFQNGTNTVKAKAPTENYQDVAMQMVSASAAFGYVIAVADYLGFGESAQLVHPYLCREATVTPLLDMLQGIVELDEDTTDALQFSLSGDLFLLGYSQGGHATMSLHEQLERTPDFPLVLQGTAAGAGPYNIAAVNQYMVSQTEYPMPYFAPYTVLAYQSLGFVTGDLNLFFNAPYAAAIPALFDGTKDADTINAGLTTDLSQLFTPAIYAVAAGETTADETALAMQNAFDTNSVPPFASTVPIRLSHGTADTYIPSSSTVAFQQAMIAAGTPAANITVLEIPEKDHKGAAPTAIVDAIRWFGELQGN